MLRPGDCYTNRDGSIGVWNLPPIDPVIDKVITDRAEEGIRFFIAEGMNFNEAMNRINGFNWLSDRQIESLRQLLT